MTVLVFALRKSQDLEEFCGVLYSTKHIYFPKQGKFGIQYVTINIIKCILFVYINVVSLQLPINIVKNPLFQVVARKIFPFHKVYFLNNRKFYLFQQNSAG